MSLDGTNVKSNERSYKYTYDGLNRFTQALYAERLSTATPTTNFTLNPGGFDEKGITYDENGNIQTLQRYSSAVGGSGGTKIDGLKYTYDTNDLNKLLTVTDTTANSAGFRNYTGTTTGNYTYDAAGNLKTDPYKRITAIAYNTLNRVDKVTLTYPSPATTGRYIDYTYDGSGKLIRKRQFDNSVLQKTTDYIDGFVYTTVTTGAAQLDYFGMPEGRVRNTGEATITLKQEFIITDHQGNARISFEDSGTGTAKVVQENSYYAYGMSMTSTMSLPTQPNKKLYNGGSEWQNDYQDQPDWQQTFYRNYDQTIGRFLAVDPMAEASGDMSVYQYGNNNPVAFNDPVGDLSKAEIESFGPLKYEDGLSGGFWKKTYGSEQEWSYAQQFFNSMNGSTQGKDIYIDKKGKIIRTVNNDNLKTGEARYYMATEDMVEGEITQGEAFQLILNNAINNYVNQILNPDNISYVGDYFEYTDKAAGVSEVLGWTKYAAFFKSAGAKYAPLVGVGINYADVKMGNITQGEYIYKQTGAALSFGLGTMVGAEFGGPWGAGVGLLFDIGWNAAGKASPAPPPTPIGYEKIEIGFGYGFN